MGAYTLIKPKATLFLTGILAVFGTFALATIFTQHTSALSGADFNAGRIIDDSVFYNSNSMNATEIQQFLNSKVPVCDTNGTQWHSSGRTRAQHGIANGAPPPYVCLKDYSQHVPAVVNSGSDLCPGSITAGTKSAAQIIFDVSRACGVNPKVLIVLLQKEQSLITDDWPWPIQYRSATGYGCPDTAPCDAEFYGFFNQVYQAAKAYKRYRANPTNYNYRADRNNTILWHPNAACGSSTVYIENQATAGLYIYTPYRPNQAALNNLYGTGDSCSSYGNRNFWRLFNDWFGLGYMPPNQSNIDWNFESLLGRGMGIIERSGQSGITPKTITYNNNIYTFYFDYDSRSLRAAIATSNGWSDIAIDGAGSSATGDVSQNVGLYPAAIVSAGKLHVFYYDMTLKDLKKATLHNNNWTVTRLDGAGGKNGRILTDVGQRPTVTEYMGTLQVFYYDASGGNLRHAWTSTHSDDWQFETLDGDFNAPSRFEADIGYYSTATTYGSSLQLFYYDASGGNLRHAWTTPTQGWKFEVLDGTSESVSKQSLISGLHPSTTTYGSSLQLFYYDASGGNLRHAWTTPTQGWKFEVLDGTSESAGRYAANVGLDVISIAPSDTTDLIIFYKANNMLRYGYTNQTTGWRFAFLDGSSDTVNQGKVRQTGTNPTAISLRDGIQVFYQEDGILRHAWGSYRQ